MQDSVQALVGRHFVIEHYLVLHVGEVSSGRLTRVEAFRVVCRRYLRHIQVVHALLDEVARREQLQLLRQHLVEASEVSLAEFIERLPALILMRKKQIDELDLDKVDDVCG